jgi:cobalt/nickel transport system permease protein
VESLYLSRDSQVHALAAHPKLIATIAFVAIVVAIPAGAWWALAAGLLLVVMVAAMAKVPMAVLTRRLVGETPFVVFAALLPFLALGERVAIGPISVSVPGLIGAATLLLKSTTGVLAGIVLSATTTPRELLSGLERLRLPAPLVSIASFMVRYAGVVVDDLARMRVARAARGFRGGALAHLRVEAAGAAALFIRSYERGERIHLAMLARGYTGRMPALAGGGASARDWVVALSLPALAAVTAAALGVW